MEFTNPTQAYTGKPTNFKLSVRLRNGWKDGMPLHHDKGETISIPFKQAEAWQRQGLGKIVSDTPAIEPKKA